ncbi:hypothetical protein [Streptomyces collinus]|uniref:hypothetical protein n=1 Tax=Streptomyces collinus TaxID=42684 RepID=UPI002942ED6E|nr:hypothetical protein [Streptomyces collinus]
MPNGGYGDRFDEDAFDYPTPSPAHAGSAEDTVADPAETTVLGSESESEPGNGASGSRRNRIRDGSRWRQAALRHRPAVTAVAALALLGGFGLALSTVSDTVTSTPDPGGTARVSAPRSPGSPSRPPDATLPTGPTGPTGPSGTGVGTATAPTGTVPPPVTGDHDDDHGEEERGREDDDHADD